MNDQTAIELVNRSLSEPLSDQESAELQRYLAESPQSQQYFQLSQLIQQTLVEHASDMESGPGLSQIARNRIAKHLAKELAARRIDPGNQARRVAEDQTDYQIRPDDPDGPNDPPAP
jgi:ferric-dicitrate binding protein FerR (iron transport regulator)